MFNPTFTPDALNIHSLIILKFVSPKVFRTIAENFLHISHPLKIRKFLANTWAVIPEWMYGCWWSDILFHSCFCKQNYSQNWGRMTRNLLKVELKTWYIHHVGLPPSLICSYLIFHAFEIFHTHLITVEVHFLAKITISKKI